MLNYSVAELRIYTLKIAIVANTFASFCAILDKTFILFFLCHISYFCFAAKIRKYHEIRKKNGKKFGIFIFKNAFPVDSCVIKCN